MCIIRYTPIDSWGVQRADSLQKPYFGETQWVYLLRYNFMVVVFSNTIIPHALFNPSDTEETTCCTHWEMNGWLHQVCQQWCSDAKFLLAFGIHLRSFPLALRPVLNVLPSSSSFVPTGALGTAARGVPAFGIQQNLLGPLSFEKGLLCSCLSWFSSIAFRLKWRCEEVPHWQQIHQWNSMSGSTKMKTKRGRLRRLL